MCLSSYQSTLRFVFQSSPIRGTERVIGTNTAGQGRERGRIGKIDL